ncbi:MAG: methyltransferase domain-containing protein, partial [Cyclobacteriaceae bacterium]
MSLINSSIEKHYSNSNIYERILARLKEQGVDLDRITRNDLAGVDEFHVRGAEVSLELAEQIGLNNTTKVLDVGCGIGGPARMLAETYGCKVTGIDLTADYVEAAELLSEHLGLQDLTQFMQANALELPFEDSSFDVVWTQHVQMNVENKKQMYGEI